MAPTETLTSGDADQAVPLALIDCDMHPFIPIKEAYERMSKRARASIGATPAGGGHFGGGREHNRFLHPTGPLRLDAVPPNGGLAGSDPEFAVSHYLEGFGISAALMLPTQSQSVISWGDEEAVGQFLTAINDLFLEHWHGRDPRFKVLVSVSPHSAETAVKEIERLCNREGVVGIQVPMAELSMGSASMFRVFEAAAHHALPVVLHPNGADGILVNSPGHAGLMTRSYAERHSNLCQVGQGSLASLVLSGTLARLPDLRVVLSEFGFSWVGPMMWRMNAFWERSGGAVASIMKRPPGEYVVQQMRFTTQPFDEPERRADVWPLLEAMQAERTLLFSSDYPHWDTDNPQIVIENRLPAKLRSRVASENALETFGARLCL